MSPDATTPGPGLFVTDDAQGFELDPRPAEVVVFGSHLAFGSVGLNAGLPVYAEAGIRCAAIPTIVLSNLPHYRSVQAIDVSADWITASLRDLTAAGALRSLRAVAVGYLAAPSQAHAIADWYLGLDPAARPPLVLDPTFGDADVGFYTDPAVAPALRERLVPLATVVTPNLFELAHLTAGDDDASDVAPSDISTTVVRARTLLASDDASAIVTGVRTGDGEITNLVVGTTTDSVVAGREIPTGAKGLGDTFTATLVAAQLHGASLTAAVEAGAARVRRAIEDRERARTGAPDN
ncbi:bifunctional hydroxymethylpyrimidine kinase/phosphomethylpyrimidine kinase [Gordonia sp. (in: high G+C Gram-positive bacteria)]|uniref:bifunctional hydroxymethylpyrimidine kinase/phosphomethylpyrimidine kinase n=1 Tax=Gordonia sp. (in: high G+C Gram-positive bacteria) TaxID=84139 RepID=UPI0016A0C02C|nr:bifunctional hydroxymethylpyrimidine kinase/phosphomethylpyrimidine kinase [Gordonia sp. (in: high G+C Gram-positive bacteria)]NLG46382.1 pyridoxine/pyridoxal/pyridoxamine kinase [Gordonia sp. (in: high G+C Gram-positive bacteria)]